MANVRSYNIFCEDGGKFINFSVNILGASSGSVLFDVSNDSEVSNIIFSIRFSKKLSSNLNIDDMNSLYDCCYELYETLSRDYVDTTYDGEEIGNEV